MKLILTATATQARFLRDRWAAEQIDAGLSGWETPPILSLQAWARQQWGQLQQHGTVLPLLLSADQERWVWQQTLPDELIESQRVLRKRDLIEHAMHANRLFHGWRGEEEQFESLLTDTHLEEIELFAMWQQRFEVHCESAQWVTGTGLVERLRQFVLQGAIELPQQLERYGDSGWNRAEQRLVEALQMQGVRCTDYEMEPLTAACAAVVMPDPEAELQWVAHAVAQQLQKVPDSRIGVVVPGLRSRRDAVDRCFRQRLIPQSEIAMLAEEQLPYRLSQGRPLLDDPRVHHALQLLTLAYHKLPLLELSSLLRSPWLLLGEEMELRAQLDLKLRALGLLEVSLERLLQLFQSTAPMREHEDEQSEAQPLSRFQGALQALQALELRQKRSPSAWSEIFARALAFFEWAENGEQSLVAFNAYNGWREGLDRFVALDRWIGECSAESALGELRQVMTTIELEVGRSARPVEIMLPSEAIGVQFDALWVLSCDDGEWPQQQRLTPFLPQQWQRQRVPGVDHRSAQQLAKAYFSAQRGAAAAVCFSCSEGEAAGGESVRGLTPLLGEVPLQHYTAADETPWWVPHTALPLEEVEDRAVELAYGSAVRGGSTLLANQSQCPFRAFVRHRLQATALEVAQPGLDARERGTLLHELLERCWRELGQNSQQLQQMEESQLRKMVEKIAAGTVAQFRDRLQERIGPRFAENEWRRLTALTLQALQLDRQRETPFEVEEMERQHSIELAGLELSIKMDRVDRLPDGGRVLIDYKSGKVSRSEWQGERPLSPQLPLYAILLNGVAAVLYSQIRADEVRYRGEQQAETVMAGASGSGRSPSVVCSEAWLDQLQQWRDVVEQLALEFRSGVATVDPLQGEGSCQYCGLQPLCRVL